MSPIYPWRSQRRYLVPPQLLLTYSFQNSWGLQWARSGRPRCPVWFRWRRLRSRPDYLTFVALPSHNAAPNCAWYSGKYRKHVSSVQKLISELTKECQMNHQKLGSMIFSAQVVLLLVFSSLQTIAHFLARSLSRTGSMNTSDLDILIWS